MQTTSVRPGDERVVTAAVTPAESPLPAISWAAVIAGAFAMAAIALILLALGAGLGFASVSPWSNSNPSVTAFSVAAAVWLIVVQWLSAAFGGYLTGRLRTKWVSVPGDEIYFRDTAHGFLAWAVAAVITTAVLASAASTLAGGVAKVAGAAMTSSTSDTSTAPPVAKGFDPTAYLVSELFRSDHPDSNANNQAARAETTPIIDRALSEGSIPDTDRSDLAGLVAARTGLNQPDAAKRVDEVDAQVKSVWTKARQTADQARKASAYVAFFTAFSMLIGAFIAAVMATVAGHRRDEIIRQRALL